MWLKHCRTALTSSADNLCKPFGPRPGPTIHRVWSGPKLFDTLVVFLKKKIEKVSTRRNMQNLPACKVLAPFTATQPLHHFADYVLYASKQFRYRLNCSIRSSLFWIHTVWFARGASKAKQTNRIESWMALNKRSAYDHYWLRAQAIELIRNRRNGCITNNTSVLIEQTRQDVQTPRCLRFPILSLK